MPKYLWVFLKKLKHPRSSKLAYTVLMPSLYIADQHKYRRKVVLHLWGTHTMVPLPFSHYRIVGASTTVPLFIERKWTMLHLNLLLQHCGLVPSMKCWVLGSCRVIITVKNKFYGFAFITLSIFLPKNVAQLNLQSSINSPATTCLKCEVLIPQRNSITYIFVVCLMHYQLLLSIHIFVHVWPFFSEGVVQFCIHTQANWCLDIKKHAVVTSVTSL